MPSLALAWDEEAAFASLKRWLEIAFAENGVSGIAPVPANSIARGRQNAPLRTPPAITFLAVTPAPVTQGFLPDKKRKLQSQLIEYTVDSDAPGLYAVRVLTVLDGQAVELSASFTPLPGQSATDIRDGLVASAGALPAPLTVSSIGDIGFSLSGPPGFSFGGQVLSGAISRKVADDSSRVFSAWPARWQARLLLDDYTSDENLPSLASKRADAIQVFIKTDIPVVNGDPSFYLNDAFKDGCIRPVSVVGRIDSAFQKGALWVERVTLDLEFTTVTGVAVDLPSIDTHGFQPVQLEA